MSTRTNQFTDMDYELTEVYPVQHGEFLAAEGVLWHGGVHYEVKIQERGDFYRVELNSDLEADYLTIIDSEEIESQKRDRQFEQILERLEPGEAF